MTYTPSLWTLTKTLQTLVFGLIEAYEICFPTLRYQRELLGLADGGQLPLDWLLPVALGQDKKRDIVLLVPGLSGDA